MTLQPAAKTLCSIQTGLVVSGQFIMLPQMVGRETVVHLHQCRCYRLVNLHN